MDIAVNPHLLTDFRFGYYRYNIMDSKYSTAEARQRLGIPGSTRATLYGRRAGIADHSSHLAATTADYSERA